MLHNLAALAAAPAASTASSAARALFAGTSGRLFAASGSGLGKLGRVFRNGLKLHSLFRRFVSGRLVEDFCGIDHRHGRGGASFVRNRRAQSSQRFVRLALPVGAAEALGSRAVPGDGFVGALGFLESLGKLKRSHGVARALIDFRQRGDGVRAGARLPDASLDLSPVCHYGPRVGQDVGIVTAQRVEAQTSGR